MKAQNGKIFKIKNTNCYVGEEPRIGSKIIALNGKELDEPIIITEDILEEVDKPIIHFTDNDEEDIEEE